MVDSKFLPMNRALHFLALLVITTCISPRIAAQSQAPAAPVDPAISKLAAQIAEPLQKAHLTKVVVADLSGPDKQKHPVGRWLAEQLTKSIQSDFPSLDVIVGPPLQGVDSGKSDSGDAKVESANEKVWAKKLGAKVIIGGSYARISKGIGVSLEATNPAHPGRSLSQTTGLIPISADITALSPDPIPSPKGGIARGGTGGTTLPSCILCPTPTYTDKARAAKYQGVVVLQVTVSSEGRAKNISVVQGPGMGLEEKSIEAVMKWKFKPALGADGDPVDVLVPIEVTFRLVQWP
jgi:TonB family protein